MGSTAHICDIYVTNTQRRKTKKSHTRKISGGIRAQDPSVTSSGAYLLGQIYPADIEVQSSTLTLKNAVKHRAPKKQGCLILFPYHSRTCTCLTMYQFMEFIHLWVVLIYSGTLYKDTPEFRPTSIDSFVCPKCCNCP